MLNKEKYIYVYANINIITINDRRYRSRTLKYVEKSYLDL